ncbi:hypothetical protein LINPERPRIM_LOCUS12723 [Linum perenne]
MEVRKIVVVVEDVEASRTALRWSLHNFLRHGDLLTLLHVFPNTKKKKMRLLRLQGFQLALSFKDICNSSFFNTNVEIIVTEGEDEGGKIGEIVREIGASDLFVGLHDRSFLYRFATTHTDVASNFNCRVLAIKQPTTKPSSSSSSRISSASPSPLSDVSQIEIGCLEYVLISMVPETPMQKIPYRVCPDPYSILWRWRKRRKH